MKAEKRKKEKQKGGPLLMACFTEQMERGNPFTVANYRTAMRSVRRFLGRKADTFAVGDVSQEWVMAYIRYMQKSGSLSAGSMDCYVRAFRAVYNHAVERAHLCLPAIHPFTGNNIAVPPTRKRTLLADEIMRLLDSGLLCGKILQDARNLFAFLFFARGMCFVDAFNLRWSDVSGGYINYRRSKTSVMLCVNIEPEMRELMDMYREEGSPYVFPFLRRNSYHPEVEVDEKTALRRFNRQLHKLGQLLGFTQPLTSYVARHSWASLSEASGMGISFISQGLGHCSERATHIYMKGIPSSAMDSACKDMLDKMVRNGGMANRNENINGSINENGNINENRSVQGTESGKKEPEYLLKNKRCPTLCKNETSCLSDSVTNIYLLANVRLIGI